MRLLFAAADRDLLACYARLLPGWEVETAFDGAQVLTRLAEGGVELLVVSRDLPRVGWERIVRRCNELGLPVVVLLPEPVRTRTLLSATLADAYLPLPFRPDELRALLQSVWEKRRSGRVLRFDGFEADVSGFCLETLPLTAGELDLLAGLEHGGCLPADADGVCIGALNAKLARLHFGARIRYQPNLGFRMVNEHESS